MQKKKIIIFYSEGGGGHISTMEAIRSYLENEYEIEPVVLFKEVFQQNDPAYLFSFGKIHGEDVYNFFLHYKWLWLLNTFYYFATWFFPLKSKTLVKKLRAFIARSQPDVIISVTPLINQVILDAAQLSSIPVIIIPTDLDARGFIVGLKNPHYKRFILLKSFDLPEVQAALEPAHISSNHLITAGFPIRKDFFESKNRDKIKTTYQILSGKPIVMLMMGGQGCYKIVTFARKLTRLSIPVHLLICVGKDKKAQAKIESLSFPSFVTYTIIPFTPRISDIMAISDLVITKSGSVSFCEVLYMNKPMLIDNTSLIPLCWEKLNHTLLIKHNWGALVNRSADLPELVTQFLTDKNYYACMKSNIEKLEKPRLDENIRALLQKLIN